MVQQHFDTSLDTLGCMRKMLQTNILPLPPKYASKISIYLQKEGHYHNKCYLKQMIFTHLIESYVLTISIKPYGDICSFLLKSKLITTTQVTNFDFKKFPVLQLIIHLRNVSNTFLFAFILKTNESATFWYFIGYPRLYGANAVQKYFTPPPKICYYIIGYNIELNALIAANQLGK